MSKLEIDNKVIHAIDVIRNGDLLVKLLTKFYEEKDKE